MGLVGNGGNVCRRRYRVYQLQQPDGGRYDQLSLVRWQLTKRVRPEAFIRLARLVNRRNPLPKWHIVIGWAALIVALVAGLLIFWHNRS